jgi:hypothetical protein
MPPMPAEPPTAQAASPASAHAPANPPAPAVSVAASGCASSPAQPTMLANNDTMRATKIHNADFMTFLSFVVLNSISSEKLKM